MRQHDVVQVRWQTGRQRYPRRLSQWWENLRWLASGQPPLAIEWFSEVGICHPLDAFQTSLQKFRQYFPDFQLHDLDITKVTRLRQQGVLLRLCNYRSCNVARRQALAAKARQAATVSAKPIDVFRELMQYMAEQRVVGPGNTLMQTTVSQPLTHKKEPLPTIPPH